MFVNNENISSPGSSINGDATSPAGKASSISTECTDLSTLALSCDIRDVEELIDTTKSVADIDAKLESVVNSTCKDPFAHYKCAFGFEADHSDPINIPTTKSSLGAAITEQIFAIITIQGGLESYCKEINSGKHEFSADFLRSETKATEIALEQLDSIKLHLKDVLKEVLMEVGAAVHDDHDVTEELRAAYGHAVPWITQYRQVARHNHVFYKLNATSLRTEEYRERDVKLLKVHMK